MKMVLKNELFESSVSKFRLMVVNPEHKQILCQYITYESFIKNMVSLFGIH